MTHEPDEIDVQMKSYIPMIHLQTRIEIGAFKADEKIQQKYLSGDFSDLISAVKYAEKHEPEFNPFSVLKKAFAEYKQPSDVEELLLKAEIAGNGKWSDFWRKYTKVN